MNPEEPVRDIMVRTMYNLDFIERRKDENGPYEVTQLVNSFLGALAHPWERIRKELMALPLSKAEEEGWPKIRSEWATDENPKTLGDLLRLIRNGVAHGNIEMWPDMRGEIQSIHIWNWRQGKRTWETTLTVETMRCLLNRFVVLVEEQYRQQLGRRLQ